MIGKIVLTAILFIASVPAVGAVLGLGVGMKAERFVYPIVLASWAVIIYFVWIK